MPLYSGCMDKLTDEQVSACALNAIFGYEPRLASGLIRALGSADAVFGLDSESLTQILGPFSKYRDRINGRAREDARKELERLQEKGCRFLPLTDPCYPALLKECEDAPAGLYIRSSSVPADIFKTGPFISVVGTRDISAYGKEWCPRMISGLASSGRRPTIVSGLAFGVDICAHMAALGNGLPTIAVIPVGIDDIYPRTHSVAAEKIAAAPGSAIITDYPPGTSAVPVNFIRRNRIIAGLSGATILIESKEKGGGTMTARLASGYGRDVYALPGRIDDIRSAGCNRLLAEKIAEPIVSTSHLCVSLGFGEHKGINIPDILGKIRELAPSLAGDADARLLVSMAEAIVRTKRITVEEIAHKLGIPYGKALSFTGILESEGFIETDLMQRCTIKNKKE